VVHGTSGSAGLFGRHVGQRAGDVALVRKAWPLLSHIAGDVEVDQHGLVHCTTDDNVGRVDVLVDHPAAVHIGQHLGQRATKVHHFGQAQRGFAHQLRQRHTALVLEGQRVGLHGDRCQLDHAVDLAQPRQDRRFVAQPENGLAANGLFDDHLRILSGGSSPDDEGAFIAVENLFEFAFSLG